MSTPTVPVILQGPAYVTFNSMTYYSKSGVKVNFKRNTFNVETDNFGKIDERMTSQTTEVSFQPVGQFPANSGTLVKYFPHSPATVGTSIITGPLVIQTATQTITYHKAGILKSPTLNLGVGQTAFGEMTFICIGDKTALPTAATYWKTLTTATVADTTFDGTRIVTDIYQAAWGATPFDHMGSVNGFTIDTNIETEQIIYDGTGVGDIILKSVTASAKFAPSSLTEADLDTMLAVDDTDALLPGQSIGRGPSSTARDLVIASTSFSATLYKVGPKAAGYIYSVGKHRFLEVEFGQKTGWTTGVPDALWAFVVGTIS